MEEVYYYPHEPEPLSTISFTAGISQNDSRIDFVMLVTQECMNDICFIDSNNIIMNYSYRCCMDFYKTDLKLTHEDATQIKYSLEIMSNGTWYEYETDYISLTSNHNSNIVNSKEKTTPGFEFISVLIVIIIILFYFHKKHNKK